MVGWEDHDDAALHPIESGVYVSLVLIGYKVSAKAGLD